MGSGTEAKRKSFCRLKYVTYFSIICAICIWMIVLHFLLPESEVPLAEIITRSQEDQAHEMLYGIFAHRMQIGTSQKWKKTKIKTTGSLWQQKDELDLKWIRKLWWTYSFKLRLTKQRVNNGRQNRKMMKALSNKALHARDLLLLSSKLGCDKFQTIQPWYDLSSEKSCNEFKEKEDSKSVWFMKKAASFGGVNILVDELQNLNVTCPDDESLSMKYDIENTLLLEGKKFDIRAYVFIYTNPLVVYLNYGHIQLATEPFMKSNFTEGKIHNTNPHICRGNKNIEDCFRPFEALGKVVGEDRMQELKQRIDSVVLFHLRAIPKLLKKKKRSFYKLGLDIAIDKHMNPYIYDINTSPANRYEEKIPFVMESWLNPWLQFLDVIQDIEIRKKLGQKIDLHIWDKPDLKMIWTGNSNKIACYEKSFEN